MTELISVYICNFNCAKYIDQSIQSVLAQSYKNYELIIVDDGSTDNSKKIIEKYRKLKSVRIFFQKNSGLIKSANFAIRASRGNFVIRLDADDYLDRNALLVLLNEIKKSKNCALVYPDYYLVNQQGEISSMIQNIDIKKFPTLKSPPNGACCLIRKECIEEVGLYDQAFDRQDGIDLFYKIISKYDLANVNLPLFYYRQHSSNLTKDDKKLLKTRNRILKNVLKKKNSNQNIELTKCIIIPVRGEEFETNCIALKKFYNKHLLFYTIENSLDLCDKKTKIILSTSDRNIINRAKKKFGKKISYHMRKMEMSFENVDYENAVQDALRKFYKVENLPRLLILLDYKFPFRDSFLIEKAIRTLLINNYNLVCGVKKEINNNFYVIGTHGLKSIGNNRSNLKFERKAVYREVGGINVFDLNYFSKRKLSDSKSIGHIIVDYKSSIRINDEEDIKKLELTYPKRDL